jgi:ADP-ribose pyrophosphatase YjhB (NUDIX family)
MAVGGSSEGVIARLETLYEAYDGFDVTQATVPVGDEAFAAADRRGAVEVRVRVEGPAGVLAVPAGDEWQVPGGTVEDETLEVAAEGLVQRQTGVEADVEDLAAVRLVCLEHEETEATRRELAVLFSATARSEATDGAAVWRDRLPSPLSL